MWHFPSRPSQLWCVSSSSVTIILSEQPCGWQDCPNRTTGGWLKPHTLTSCEIGGWTSRLWWQQVWFLLRTFPRLGGGRFLLPHIIPLCVCVLISSYKDTSHGFGSSLKTPFYHSHLLKTFLQIQSHSEMHMGLREPSSAQDSSRISLSLLVRASSVLHSVDHGGGWGTARLPWIRGATLGGGVPGQRPLPGLCLPLSRVLVTKLRRTTG